MMKYILLIFILIFVSCKTTEKKYGIYHKIEKGDTLYKLSTEYKIKIDKLKEVNNIEDEKSLKVGSYVFVPAVKVPDKITSGDKKVHSKKREEKKKRKGSPFSKKKATRKKANPNPKRAKSSVDFKWPTNGVVTSLFGARGAYMHEGLDISVPEGTPIYSAAKGKVIFSGKHGGYGNVVILSHKDGYVTIYAHNSKLLVREGESVKKGKKIALSGNTGKTSGPHLHFEIRKDSKPVNPLKYLPRKK